MADFLLELRSEEIPARMQDKARDDLARLFTAELEKAGLKTDAIVTFATPRRLALIARDLPAETAAVSEELKGPRAGAPPQALEGFLRKTGLTANQLVERDGVLFAIIDKPGRQTADVLAEAIPAIVRAFPWPKSMRWGDASASTESLRWVRPLHGIIALLGEDVVPCEIAGVYSGSTTLGHRFHHPGVITIGSAADYAEKLHACHVIVDQDERRAIIRERAAALADAAGLELIEDEGLVAENAGLTEWPVPLLGRFDEEFLQVPPEVIQLTARVNQKYFVCRDKAGKLANAFVCTANIDAADGGTKIVEGNRKVLAARLSDARFFYETDLKVPLEEQAKKLEKIVFHEKLGTVADKVERVAMLASSLVNHVFQADPTKSEHQGDNAVRAARLAKADLVTGMVGEFPELQGLMGSYYAWAQDETAEVVTAIRDQYKPVGQSDGLPGGWAAIAVNLAEKFDTITAFFVAELPPSGSRDPFALRRAALGAIRIILENNLRFGLRPIIQHAATSLALQLVTEKSDLHEAINLLREPGRVSPREPDHLLKVLSERHSGYATSGDALLDQIVDFFADRLKVQQREAGVRHDLIDAVFALGGEDDLVRLLARVRALQSFITTEDGANLLAGYKRAANILKKEDYVAPAEAGAAELSGDDSASNAAAPASAGATIPLSYTPEKAEADLIAALDAAEPAAADAVGHEDFEAAMAALATLRAPIDAFFDSVTVNDSAPEKRTARLALLARIRAAVHNVADFSKIEG